MKQLENGRYVCPGCGLSWEHFAAAVACCAKEATAPKLGEFVEATYTRPDVIEEINPSGSIHVDDAGPTVTYADTVPEPMAAELLGRAARHMHDRASTYDKPEGERSMGRTVQAFNAITGHNVTESEGWLLMALLKSVRGFTRETYHADSFEDLIAYAALCAEAKSKGL